jgi:ubiquinone/menaquinone biosynthesis C-methylase UbiE
MNNSIRRFLSQSSDHRVRFFNSLVARYLFSNMWYSLVTKLDKNAEVTVMNYGFERPDVSHNFFIDATKASERYALQLYHYVASGAALEGKDVLEVGCGRGGGASHITRMFHPRKLVGVDVNASAIRFAQRYYRDQKALKFAIADAHELPFDDNSFDTVVNIESAQHYKDVRKFLSEVHRVLRPNGCLLIACFEDSSKGVLPRRALAQSNLRKRREEDITDDVILAMELDSSRRKLLAQKLSPTILQKFAFEFAGVLGSGPYSSFVSGNSLYFNLIYQK